MLLNSSGGLIALVHLSIYFFNDFYQRGYIIIEEEVCVVSWRSGVGKRSHHPFIHYVTRLGSYTDTTHNSRVWGTISKVEVDLPILNSTIYPDIPTRFNMVLCPFYGPHRTGTWPRT